MQSNSPIWPTSFTAINTLREAGFGNDHFRELRQFRLKSRPDPRGEILAGRVLQARNFVEVTVIELFPKRPEGFGNVRVIHQPAEVRIAVAGHDNVHFETVPVKAPALVRLWEMGQQVRRFKLKRFPQLDFHNQQRQRSGRALEWWSAELGVQFSNTPLLRHSVRLSPFPI